MTASVKIAPANSLVFISDARGGSLPEKFERDRSIVSTDSCVAVGCYPFMDGETETTLGSAQEVDPGNRPTYDGTLITPTQTVVVSTVDYDKLLEAKVPDARIRLRIWTNHPSEPDKVIVGIGLWSQSNSQSERLRAHTRISRRYAAAMLRSS